MTSVETLEQHGLVVLTVDGRRLDVRLGHPVHGDVVRAQMSELRRRRLLQALADELESDGLRRRGDPVRVAVLRLDSGVDPDPEMVFAAAREACTGAGWPMAERLARAAHRTNPTLGTAELLARVLFEVGKFDEEQAILREAEAYVTSDADRALVASSRAGGLFWGLGDKAGMSAVLEDAEGSVTDVDAFWVLRGSRALFESQSGDQVAALTLLEGCPDPATELGVRAHAQIALARAFALPGVGRADEAIAMIDEAIARRGAAAPLLSVYTAGLLDAARAMALVGLGRLAEAGLVATNGHENALRAGETGSIGLFELTLGWVSVQRGQLADAVRHYREGTVALRGQRHRGQIRWGLAGILFAAALARDREVAASAEQALAELGSHPAGLFDVGIGRARAWAAIANDDPASARRELAAAIELARQRQLAGEEAACLHDKVRIGDAAEVADRLIEIAHRCDGDLVPTMARHAAGLVAGDVDSLEEAAECFGTMGFLLKAAEATMGASESAARAGDQRRASRLSQRATELAGRCQTPATPLLSSSGGPVPLTNREREVALLAAAGLPSRAIGERLYLSARTVDNHLARVYTKLGVTRRADLAAALG
jgi:DNA-binding CsgD family transcriptional regulator